MKWNASSDFRNANIVEKALHVAESTNFPYSMFDWDFIKKGGPNQHFARMKESRLEIILNIVINVIVDMLLLSPLTYLCKYYQCILNLTFYLLHKYLNTVAQRAIQLILHICDLMVSWDSLGQN